LKTVEKMENKRPRAIHNHWSTATQRDSLSVVIRVLVNHVL
jgi:hypothetical protein